MTYFEKLKTICGEYDYGNDIFIDLKHLIKNNLIYTEIHESTHLILSQGSTYGALIQLMKKAQVIDHTYDWLINELYENARKIQECIATAIELLKILKYEGQQRYTEEICDLSQDKTRSYYKKSLDIVRGLIIGAKQEEADVYVELLLQLGLISLNVDFKQIPSEIFINKQSWNKWKGDFNNIILFFPNRRLEKIVKLLKKKEENLFDKEDEVLLNCLVGINLYERQRFEVCKELVQQIYATSIHKDIINKRIDTFEYKVMEEMMPEDHALFLNIFPQYLNEYHTCVPYNLQYSPVIKIKRMLSKGELGIFYIPSSLSQIHHQNVVSYCNQKNRNVYVANPIYNDDIINLIKSTNIPTVFLGGKRYSECKDIIEKSSLGKNVYVFLDSAPINNLKWMSENIKKTIYYISSFEKAGLVCIRQGEVFILQLISLNAIELFQKAVIEYKIDMIYEELDYYTMKNIPECIYNIVEQILDFSIYARNYSKK